MATTASSSSKVLNTISLKPRWTHAPPLTQRCGVADGEGGQCGVQPVHSVVKMLSEEDVALHWVTGQGM